MQETHIRHSNGSGNFLIIYDNFVPVFHFNIELRAASTFDDLADFDHRPTFFHLVVFDALTSVLCRSLFILGSVVGRRIVLDLKDSRLYTSYISLDWTRTLKRTKWKVLRWPIWFVKNNWNKERRNKKNHYKLIHAERRELKSRRNRTSNLARAPIVGNHERREWLT